MQLKTIKKVITKKLDAWINTLPENLRSDVKKSILVSGGSIANMLLREDVNDYDVYFSNIEVLKKVVEHYVKNYEVEILDGRLHEKYKAELSNDYKGVFENVDDIQNKYAIAVRNLQPEQIKLFMGAGQLLVPDVKEGEELYLPKFFSPNAISLTDKVQIVCRFTGDADKIHETFDFIHATNYFTYADGIVTNKEALESLLTKHLRYQGSKYPLTSIIRSKKFIKRGWNIGAGEYLKIMFQISELDLKNPDVLNEQLIGVDVAYFSKLIEILRGVNASDITSQYLNVLIDRVFDSSDETE